jgi:hypothetical protein
MRHALGMRKDPLAVLALVTGFLVPPVGVVLGGVSLKRMRHDPVLSGRRLALAAVWVGVLLTVTYVAITLALFLPPGII